MADLILIGAGGHARSCIDVVEMQGIWHIHGILDIPEKVGALVMGYPVIGTDADIERYASKGFTFLNCLGQVGASPVRMRVAEMLQSLRAEEAVVVSPLAHVAKSASIGKGTIICHHALVNACAVVGRGCIINSKALIEHDTIVEDYCHISTGAILNGGVRIGRESFVGSHATVVQGAQIASNSFIKAGALVK